VIDLRSDTFSLPTPPMREAIATAEVGNDVYREDPTVRHLEELVADVLGMDAACLMPSGTMANLTAIMAHVPRGGKLICGDESDIYLHEAGGASVCGGAVYHPVTTQADGRLALDDLAAAFPADNSDPEFAPPGLICLENTHNRRGGRVLGPRYLSEVHELARAGGVPVHLDGARFFNAVARLGLPPADLAQHVESLQFCLSKGLSAPIGSMLAGTTPVIDRARRIRKMLGGGMRQAGIIAAAGIVAMNEMRERLIEDHDNARHLAAGLAASPDLIVDTAAVETNIVMFRADPDRFTTAGFIDELGRRGVAVAELGGTGLIRAVTYADIDRAAVDRAIEIICTAAAPTALATTVGS
jgi:threonine aldolase